MSDSVQTSTEIGALNPLAPEHLPYFIPAADGSDHMLHTAIYFLLFFAFVGGVLYLHMHSLPERMAHGHGRTQFQIVAMLGLLALFTHENLFWIAALLLAATTLPDFLTPITSGARSLAGLAGREYEGDAEREDDPGLDPGAPLHHHVPGTPTAQASADDPFQDTPTDTPKDAKG